MFKSLLIIVIVSLVLWGIRSFMQRIQNSNEPRSIQSKDTVQCLTCKAYIPHDKALRKGNNHFCSQQHYEDWTSDN